MSERPVYRRHAAAFKEQVCRELRTGQIGRREAQQRYGLSDNLIHQWLHRYDLQQPVLPPADQPVDQAEIHAACVEKIHELERKIGQLVMELERCGADVHDTAQRGTRPAGPGTAK
jgi:transposase